MPLLVAAGDLRSIGADGEDARALALGDGAERAGAGKVPQLGRVVRAARSDPRTIGTDGDTKDKVLMPGRSAETLDLLAGGAVQHLDAAVAAAGDDVLAI